MKTRAKRREEELSKKRTHYGNESNNGNGIRRDDDDGDGGANNNDETDATVAASTRYRAYPHCPYVCVYCGTPCSALYRQLTSSLSSIKAMHCEKCQRIVDPYIEREWLLVVIDCILLRPEAWRHLLYNNKELSWHGAREKEGGEKGGGTGDARRGTVPGVIVQGLIQGTLASGLFHAYLKRQTLVHDHPVLIQQYQYNANETGDSWIDEEFSFPALLYGIFLVTSILDIVVQWLAIYGCLKLLSAVTSTSDYNEDDNEQRRSTKATAKKQKLQQSKLEGLLGPPRTSHSLAYQIYLALLLPTSAQLLSVLVLVWENSKMTRALGSLLVACWQSLAVSIISIHYSNRNYYSCHNGDIKSSGSPANGNSSCTKLGRMLASVIPVLVGVASLIAWRLGVVQLLAATGGTAALHPIPCVGFEMDSSFHFWGGAPSALRLCLT